MTSNISKLKPLSLYRSILSELSKRKQVNSPAQKYILEQFKSNKVPDKTSNQPEVNRITSMRHCRGQDAAVHDAETYLALLNSTRVFDELILKYHGDGEDTTKKAANRVGLSLPDLYKDSRDGESDKE